jgi:hydrogenase maturation protease
MITGQSILVLGIGNILWADEGFGVRVVEAMHERYRFEPNVRVVDGGTLGLGLLPWIEDADVLLIFDAIDYGMPAGSLRLIDDADVPRYLTAKKMSLHQTNFQDVLALASLSGRQPARMRLVGVQPLDLESYGGCLSGPVEAQIDAAIAAGIEFLAQAGFRAEALPCGTAAEPLGPASVARQPYERGRPQALSGSKGRS